LAFIILLAASAPVIPVLILTWEYVLYALLILDWQMNVNNIAGISTNQE
jgi:hypothetical protein